jgi:hypothetical protein
MRKIKIKPELLSLLTTEKFNRFTGQTLIDAYMGLPSSSDLNQRQVQQFIFRNLERLVCSGLVSRENKERGLQAEYRLTNKFTFGQYDIGTPHCILKSLDTTTEAAVGSESLIQLQDRLNIHKLELLTTIAETEEYESLCKQLPSKQSEIQELYNDARNRYSKTLGKVKAIESLISHTGKTD